MQPKLFQQCITISMLGNFGDAAAFSLHPMKNLSVPGDGGFLEFPQIIKKFLKKFLLLRDAMVG